MTGIEMLGAWIEQYRYKTFGSNQWLEASDMKVYVRASRHLCNGALLACLDIASVEVYRKRKGTFTRFLEYAISANPWSAVYVESVVNPDLERFLQRRGFLQADDPGCYYLPRV